MHCTQPGWGSLGRRGVPSLDVGCLVPHVELGADQMLLQLWCLLGSRARPGVGGRVQAVTCSHLQTRAALLPSAPAEVRAVLEGAGVHCRREWEQGTPLLGPSFPVEEAN